MVLVLRWCEARGAPVAEGIAASDLLGNFGAQNIADTLECAANRYGLHPAGCAQAITDGAFACAGENGESKKFLAKMFARADGADSAVVENARKEICAIHAKALEGNYGVEAAFPGQALCDWTSLIWECFSFKRVLSPACMLFIIHVYGAR
eukprot:6213429-Pleurochrysis_carterae.AAC.4